MHLNKKGIILFSIIISLFYTIFVFAIRLPPDPVEPVVYNGIKYTVSDKMGYVEAWDVENNTKIWEKRVYRVFYYPFLERDVQWVFITNLNIEGDKLIVINERDDRYELNLKTGKILNKPFPILPIVLGIIIITGVIILIRYKFFFKK